MKIVLLGATRGVGLQFLQQALAKGDKITALVRSPEKIADLQNENLTIIQGDAFQIEDLRKCMKGQDAVVSCLNTSKGINESDELQRMMQNCVEAMTEFGIKRIVYCASAGVEDEIPGERGKEAMHFLRHPLHDHKKAIEKIKLAKLDFTIARPGGLMDGDFTGKYNETEIGIPESSNRIIRADVADFMLKAVHNDNYIGKSVGIMN